jgi:hypothetical protein
MSFQWLQLRITEEKERRDREAQILVRLPGAVDELGESLAACVEAYKAAFPADVPVLTRDGLRLTIKAGAGRVNVVGDPQLPGFQIQGDGATLSVQVGILPGKNLFYLDLAADQYLSMEELTRKILDRILFPKLKEQ